MPLFSGAWFFRYLYSAKVLSRFFYHRFFCELDLILNGGTAASVPRLGLAKITYVMENLKRRLAALDPPIKHAMEMQGETIVITLIDPKHLVKTTRAVRHTHLRNQYLLYDLIRDAVNELRTKADLHGLDLDELQPDDSG